MASFGHSWRAEKAKNVISRICWILKTVPKIPVTIGDQTFDLRDTFFTILYDATKLYCEAIQDRTSENTPTTRWSPELVDYLFDHPETCDDTLQVIASPDYRDNYYDRHKHF